MMDWNYLILSRIKKILSSISSTQKLIGTTTDIDGDSTKGTLMAKENAILGILLGFQNGNLPIVKSIQRGSGRYDSTKNAANWININTVNPNKCIVLLNSESNGASRATLGNIEATRFSITTIYIGGVIGYSWQLVEFW